MLNISFTNQYLKDLELMKRRNLPKSELDEVSTCSCSYRHTFRLVLTYNHTSHWGLTEKE